MNAFDLALEAVAEFRADVAKRKASILQAEEELRDELTSIRRENPECEEAELSCTCKWKLLPADCGSSYRGADWRHCKRHEAIGVEL